MTTGRAQERADTDLTVTELKNIVKIKGQITKQALDLKTLMDETWRAID